MMNKMKKIFLILIITFALLGINMVYAAEANIVATSAEVGGDINVTVTFPNECVSYEGIIKVIFADGTEVSSEKYAFSNDPALEKEFSRTITYKAKANVVGNGTAKIVNLTIVDASGKKINVNDSVQTGFKVSAAESSNIVMDNVSSKDTNTVGNTTVEEKEEIKVTIKEEVKKTMYVAGDVSSCNVRNADSKKAEIIGGLKRAAEVKVTGITSNGWYRIEYYGETAYVADVLTDEKPEVVQNEVKNAVQNETENVVLENKIDNTNELNELKNVVGILPEVGNNILDVLFVIISIFCLIYAFYISYKKRES